VEIVGIIISTYTVYIPKLIQQNATLRILLYLEIALHVSGGTSTYHTVLRTV
jgi:hypothetical protein